MKQFKTLKELLDFIVETSKADYYDGFRSLKPEFDNNGHPMYEIEPLVVDYCGQECMFDGGMISICSMLDAYKYDGMFFRVGKTLDGPMITFAPKAEMLNDETWAIFLEGIDEFSILCQFESIKRDAEAKEQYIAAGSPRWILNKTYSKKVSGVIACSDYGFVAHTSENEYIPLLSSLEVSVSEGYNFKELIINELIHVHDDADGKCVVDENEEPLHRVSWYC